MDVKTGHKARLPSRHVTEGPDRAAHRASYQPVLADLKRAGRYVAKDIYEARRVPLVRRTLLDHGFIHGECVTVTGRAVAGNLKRAKWNKDQDVVHPADMPLSATGGVVGFRGNLAPEGATVKVAGMASLKFIGRARCFDGEEARFETVKKKKYREGEVLVIRYEGPQGGPGMREMSATTAALHGQGMGGKLREGDVIAIDAEQGTLHPGAAAEKACHADI
jgi:dihydroxy-acid dehydratase